MEVSSPKFHTEKDSINIPKTFPRELHNVNSPTDMIQRLRNNILHTPQEIDIERARFTTQSYQNTENEPIALRRAKMLKHLVENMEIKIDEGAIIVGNRSSSPRMGIIAPEGAVAWVNKELDTFPTRPQDKFDIKQDYINELRDEIFPYWRGKTLEEVINSQMPHDVNKARNAHVFSLNQTDHAQGHILPDVEGWLNDGIRGIRKKIETAERDLRNSDDKRWEFYEAANIALDAASYFIQRYADKAKEQAESIDDPNRKKELLEISQNCLHLATNPPDSFWQAVQAMWFLFVLLQIESNASSISPGRLDQYLYPYLKNDLVAGILSMERAQEILENLWINFNEIVMLRSSESARYFAGFPTGFNVIVGGQKNKGEDATNLLSYMCLRAQADLGLPQPNFSIRIHQNSPQDFLEAATYVIGKGSGMPQVFNDEDIIAGQRGRGISEIDALNYAVVGCVELSTPGKSLGWSDAAMCNMVRILELTLYGGRDPITDEQIGIQTPPLPHLHSFDDLEEAYTQQLDHFITLMIKGCNLVDQTHAELLPSPLLSLVVQDCIQKGVDVTSGGAHYNFSGVQGVQVANVADSFLAIKKAIYDEKWLTPDELLEKLRNNFKDEEVLRQRLINKIPKYGNDEIEVDRYAKKWADTYSKIVTNYKNVRGGIYQPGFYTVSAHIPMGSHVGATPDGRMRGMPLADGGLSPAAGRDKKGPTAVLNSVSKINLELATNGTLLNMKFLPSLFENRNFVKKFAYFLRGFCLLKIPHVQFNVISARVLHHAKSHPEEYRNLLVRVAGYSAYFVELDAGLQDEIIKRTEFSNF